VLFALLAVESAGRASEPAPIVAVFDIEDRGTGLSAETLSNLTDYLVVLLTAGGYEVVPRRQLKERINQQKEEGYKACYDQSCQVELGRELAAQKSLSTQIFQVGGVCRLTATLIDLKKATTEKACFVKSECGEKQLLVALEELSQKLTGHEIAEPTTEPAKNNVQNKQAQEAQAAIVAARLARRRKAAEQAKANEAAQNEKKKVPQPPLVRRAGQTELVGIYDVTIGFHPGVVFSDLGETLSLDIGEGKAGEVKMGTGVALDTQVDFKLSGPPSAMYMGGFVLYYYAKDSLDSDVVKYLAAGMIMRLHFTLLPNLEIRLSTEIGIGFHLGTSIQLAGETDPREFDGEMGGLFCKPTIELAWYPLRNFGVLLEFGTMFDFTSEMSVDNDTYSFNLPPLLLLSVGLEIGG